VPNLVPYDWCGFIVPNIVPKRTGMFIRKKKIGGKDRHYLVKSVWRGGKPRQKVLAYLGQFDSVEDAWMNATGKRRKKLEQYRRPEDRMNDELEQLAQREYERQRREAPPEVLKLLLPHLHTPKPKRKPTPLPKGFDPEIGI